ncbi:MAG: hypothetical protein JSV36_09140 [Anaerolineae bacterium]|nr:MAG: hypothetical protein JSV36_09140 [Anaerolineae bacterium]
MNSYPNRDPQTQDSLLDAIEQAMEEKAQIGRADEARYGFVAQMANATPPLNEAFRRTLRARILTQGTQEAGQGLTRQALTRRDRTIQAGRWRFALVTLMAVLIVTLALTYNRTQIMERNDVPVGQPSGRRLMAEDFDALAQALNSAPAPRTVIVYPDFASPIAERVRHRTVPLVLGKDTTPAAISGEVGRIVPSGGFVDLVMAGAEADDTTRQVQVAMERALYRLYRPSGQADTEVYGALEHSTFLAGPAELAVEPIGAVFEGGIELVAGDLLDDPQPGRPVRMAFDWRIQDPVSDSLVMFVHLVHQDVALIAQRDAVPGHGLLPVEDWKPGELVRDQFALLLPPALPAGEYEIRVGIYDSATQMRYSLVEPGGGTYIVVRNWAFASPQEDQNAGFQARVDRNKWAYS